MVYPHNSGEKHMAHTIMTYDELEITCPITFRAPFIQPLILVGGPGVAKSQWIEHIYTKLYANHLGIDPSEVGYIEENLVGRDAAEACGLGIPMKDEETGEFVTKYTLSSILERVYAAVAEGFTYGVLNFDEVMAYELDMQKALSPAFNPEIHKINQRPLPPGWILAGTGNRTKDKAGAIRLLSQNTNRCLVAEINTPTSIWAKWAGKNDVCPVVIDCAVALEDQQFFVDSVPTEDGAFSTWRSATRAASHLAAYIEDVDFDGFIPPVIEKLLAMNIGAVSAKMLVNYAAQAGKVPTVEEILADPEGCTVPDQTGFQMLAGNTAIYGATDEDSAERVLQYIVRLRPDLQVSLGTKLMKVSTRKGFCLTSGLANEFMEKFHDMLPLTEDD